MIEQQFNGVFCNKEGGGGDWPVIAKVAGEEEHDFGHNPSINQMAEYSSSEIAWIVLLPPPHSFNHQK